MWSSDEIELLTRLAAQSASRTGIRGPCDDDDERNVDVDDRGRGDENSGFVRPETETENLPVETAVSVDPTEEAPVLPSVEELLLTPARPQCLVMMRMYRERNSGIEMHRCSSYLEKIATHNSVGYATKLQNGPANSGVDSTAPYALDGFKSPSLFLAARRRIKCTNQMYVISTDENDVKRGTSSCVGYLRANYLGCKFTLYDTGLSPKKCASKFRPPQAHLRQELAAIVYQFDPLGFNGPRQMTVILPGFDESGRRFVIAPRTKNETLLQRFEMGNTDGLLVLNNRTPIWDEARYAHVLNFHGRVTRASVKNFQIEAPNAPDCTILQFGRVGEEEFTCDYGYPLSGLQAFGIALTALACNIRPPILSCCLSSG